MAHITVLRIELVHKEVCSGCPCKHSEKGRLSCSKGYWDSKDNTAQYVWFNSKTKELQEPSDMIHVDETKTLESGWFFFAKRPQKCIDEIG